MMLFLVALFCVVWGNDRPIVGILDQPYNKTHSYIAASYVKFVESAGGRVVPLNHKASPTELSQKLSYLNGILFAGGGTALRPGVRYFDSAQIIFQQSIQPAAKELQIPIWGTCLGFELLSILAANDTSVLCDGCFNTEGVLLPLNFTSIAKTSRLYGNIPPNLYQALSTQDITENSHVSGVSPQTFKNNARLNAFFDVLSVNEDDKGKEFASSFEAKNYAIYGTQFHPEKNAFEWTTQIPISHTSDAISITQYFADFFISATRVSTRKFPSLDEENAALIYNYSPIKDPSGYYQQIYVF
eukprot:NODE_5176_length_1054_cov_49.340494_g4618_i0.p1 GENE.NODE_5176_length_1054_cov_49.340494_g4618_i0~~NODE_5176_length_1054_cov_49.340494_g4618_i0.p1  ORF type:complete len:300 (-),score=33.05 NODE_5176_length_1054_cov_49.340494_g4618_i0:107-1006(-)